MGRIHYAGTPYLYGPRLTESDSVSLIATFQGNYGRLPRILFYCTIVFCLLSSHLEWLIAGALAAALTYSAIAAAHVCMLLWIGPSYGDLDFYALCALLSTSCLIAVPLVNWSSTLRNLGSQDNDRPGTRLIIIYWAILVNLGFALCFWKLWLSEGLVTINVTTVRSIFCVPPTSIVHTVGQGLSLSTPFPPFQLDADWINDNGCMDPCAHGSFVWPAAIFRSLSDLQMPSRDEVHNILRVMHDTEFYSLYLKIGAAMCFFALHQSIWAIYFGRRSPRQCRRVIYFFLRNSKIESRFRRTTSSRGGAKWQKRLAKYIAIIAYLWAVLSTVLSVVLFVFNVIAMELLLSYFPQSETAKHVGAWSPWAATGLILAAALISKIPHRPFQAMTKFSFQTLKRIGALVGSGVDSAKQSVSRQETSKQHQPAPTNLETHGPIGKAKPEWLSALPKSIRKAVASCGDTIRDEWRSLVDFWRDADGTETVIA